MENQEYPDITSFVPVFTVKVTPESAFEMEISIDDEKTYPTGLKFEEITWLDNGKDQYEATIRIKLTRKTQKELSEG